MLDYVNILHAGAVGRNQKWFGAVQGKLEQFYGAATPPKVVPLRWCKATTVHAVTMGSPTVISIHEKTWFFHGFRGNIVTGITGNISSDQGRLFGTFLMKNIFIKFPTPIFNHVFCSFSLKISCFFEPNLMLVYECRIVVQTKPMKIIAFFDEIMKKWWFKIGVGNLMKIFFIRNVTNNIPLTLKMFPVMPLATFPR